MLVDGLPDDCRTHRIDPAAPAWGLLEELVAQVVEEVSIMAAQRAREEPYSIPRPWAALMATAPKEPVHVEGTTTTYTGFEGMLAAARSSAGQTVYSDG